MLGVADAAEADRREPTFAVVKEGLTASELAGALCSRSVYCTSGNHYASFWGVLGIDASEGAARLGLLHYNTESEVEAMLEALEAA